MKNEKVTSRTEMTPHYSPFDHLSTEEAKKLTEIFETNGNSIWNMPFYDHVVEHVFGNMDIFSMQDECDAYLEVYPDWIESSKLNKIEGLRSYPNRFVSLGTTQGMDWWHYWCLQNGREFRMFRGEYPYNRDAILGEEWLSHRYIDDTPLSKGDALLISLPFSGTGAKHAKMEESLDFCDANDIPVFVDMAWFGTCHGIEINLDRKCIKMVAFSTTKGLSCGNWRAGIVFSKLNEGALAVQTEWKHGIHLNVCIANELMRNFGPDTMPKKYMKEHVELCEHYGLEPTNTIHIAQAPEAEQWKRFKKDGVYNRVNIRHALKNYKQKGTWL